MGAWNYIKAGFAGVALFSFPFTFWAGFESKEEPARPAAQSVLERELRISSYISQFGYGIIPKSNTDDLLLGIYGVSPCVSLVTRWGDTLSGTAQLLYRDASAWEAITDSNPSLAQFKPDQSLPEELRFCVRMFDFQKERFAKDYPSRIVYQ